jgi:hypothetical protein
MRPTLFARHPYLREHPDCVANNGAWERWHRLLPELEEFPDLVALMKAWASRRTFRCHIAIAALANHGSRRGVGDDDAALAVLAVLHNDIDIIAIQLAEICEPDEVLWAVWDAIRRSKPTLGCRASYYLLHRAIEKLVLGSAPGSVERPHPRVVELQAQRSPYESSPLTRGDEREAADELSELLTWATATGVVPEADALLLKQLMLLEHHHRGREAAMRHAGAVNGVGIRTVRRRRSSALERLRQAVPDYLEAVS